MILKVGDLVEVIIVEWNLCGLHSVKIINFNNYDGILMPNTRKMCEIYYTGLKLIARVIRINKTFVDLTPIVRS